MSNFPKVEYVIHESRDLPKLGKVKFRPFLVGEHRRLLEAIELGTTDAVLNTMCAIVQACTFDVVKVDKVEMHIIDALYLDIYIKSRGSVNQAVYRCIHEVNGPDGAPRACGTEVQVNMPLDRAWLDIPEGYKESEIVKISPTAGLKLRQATLEDYKKVKADGAYSITDEFLFSSIECIFDGERVLTPGIDYTIKELAQYIDELPDEIMLQVSRFFENSPKLRLQLDITCPSCGHTEKLKLEGLDSFFV